MVSAPRPPLPFDGLADFIVSASLYRSETLDTSTLPDAVAAVFGMGVPAPKMVKRHCVVCAFETFWSLDSRLVSEHIQTHTINHLRYVCRNCTATGFDVFLLYEVMSIGGQLAASARIEKVGQRPRLDVTVPPDFETALGRANTALYRKAMLSRHSSFGIGAHAYLRRVIESTTDKMLGVLEQAMIDTGAEPPELERLRTIRAGKPFDEKIKLAGEAMPRHLKPGGFNPFADLHALLSQGLHALSDEECCDIVDSMDRALKYVYTRLAAHADDAEHYKAAAVEIRQRTEKQQKAGS